MSKEQNKTPRTQVAIKTYGDYIRSEDAVPIEFAEQLEIELVDAQAEIEKLKNECSFCGTKNNAHHSAACIDNQAKKDKLIEQMRETLALVDKYFERNYWSLRDGSCLKKTLGQSNVRHRSGGKGK